MNKTIEATLFKKAYEKTPLDLKIKISKYPPSLTSDLKSEHLAAS